MRVKPSINWSHVSPQFRWLAVDETGKPWLYEARPEKHLFDCVWVPQEDSRLASAEQFASYCPGACNWTNSLLERPEGV